MAQPSPPRPALSVVVGSSNARTSVEACLGTLVAQCERAGAELLVVDNSDDGTDRQIRERFPEVRLLRPAGLRYIPELWGVGMEASSGEVVAITTAHCVPADDWVERVLDAHAADDAAGIGGAIEADPASLTSDWAVYFARYARFMPPLAPATVDDIAGDNASYKRWALDRYRSAWRDGFWEPDVHAEIRREGGTLRLDPRIVVFHRHSFGASAFLRNRYEHGQQYGASRAARGGARLAHALRAPLVPGVLLARVARTVIAKRRHARPFVFALPLLGLFFVNWAAGEARGAFAGRGSEDEPSQ